MPPELFAPEAAPPLDARAAEFAAGMFLWPGFTGPRGRRARERLGSFEKIWTVDPRDLAEIWKPEIAADFEKWRESAPPAESAKKLENLGVRILARGFAGYPPTLGEISNPPEFLAVRGALPDPAAEPFFAIVGPRAPSPYGREVTEVFARELARAGVTIVSGLALGTDTIAHRAAVAAGGRTVCVLGCGIDQIYPTGHAGFADEILKNGSGALVSEYPPGVSPRPEFFPARNRIVAGISRGALAPEAAEKSGSLITLKLALEENREVFVVPGRIFDETARGTNSLLREGAIPALAPEDILENLGIEPAEARDAAAKKLPPAEQDFLKKIPGSGATAGEIASAAGLPFSEVAARLIQLQMRGLVSELGGGRWRRV